MSGMVLWGGILAAIIFVIVIRFSIWPAIVLLTVCFGILAWRTWKIKRYYKWLVLLAFIGGPVLLLHGTKDSIVPMWCSEQYLETYGSRATLVKVDGENHLITRRKKEICNRTVTFFEKVFI